MKKTIVAVAAVSGAAYLATHQDKVRLPFISQVAGWEHKLRVNGHRNLAGVLARYDTLRGKRD